MKSLLLVSFGFLWCVSQACPALAAGSDGTKLGGTAFIAYEGEQNWPTAESAEVVKDFAVPIYYGLPTKSYKILGRIYDSRTTGIGVVGKAFDEGLDSEKHRQRNCANQAKQQGADAVIVTNNEKILKALGLSERQIRDSAPLFKHKDKVVLAIQFK